MARTRKMGGLGRGLEALIPAMPEAYEAAPGEGAVMTVPLESVSVNPYQPRRAFDDEKLAELTESIKEHGVLQPVLVRRLDEGYQLVAGERRARAALAAGLTEIPAYVRELGEREMMEFSLIENIQRQDLDPVEEARAYRRLSSEFGLTQDQIARRVSKSRPYVANSVRLLNLPGAILDYLSSGKLSAGHARPLLALSEKDAIGVADRLIEEMASARDAELWAREITEGLRDLSQKDTDVENSKTNRVSRDAKSERVIPVALKEIQRIIRDKVNTKVDITQSSMGGKIIIDYYSQDDLERILELFTGSPEIN